ncbi:MAG: ABC transporter ATP-binding protein [Nocardioidaceae bacterium]
MTDPVADEVQVRVSEPAPIHDVGLEARVVIVRGVFRLDVAFSVAPGEILGVLGPNGAGKTTLLRALAGLTALTEGHIRLDEETLDNADIDVFVPAEQRPVGLVFQNYRLFPHLSVRDNVAFAPRCRRVGRRTAKRLADTWLQRLALTTLADRKPTQLSGGQAQQVALARALAANPRLLLLDEPLAALDARTKLEVRAELRRHLMHFSGPTLIVTHDPLEAMVMSDRLIVIENGSVVQQGTPAEVARHPATQYIARLVGLNLYTGIRSDTADAVDAAEVKLDGGGTLIVTGTAEPDRQPGNESASTGRVLAVVRPTAIGLHTARPDRASPRNVWQGAIAGIELLTDRVRVQVDANPPALVDVTPSAVAELDLTDGTIVWLSVKATDIEVYPNPTPADQD